MNRKTQFRRKLIYLAILVVMLIPLYLLGQPAGGGGDGGGQLALMRDNFDISESDLGEISPASETMKLASLGLRGVAASMLWKKSHEYHVLHEWDRLKATLNNILLLQPHFDKVWEFQAHNLAYNVSTEFDDYRQRYEMVREGTEFLTKGVRQNTKAPRLIWYTGWFYGSKLGTSDEKRQFRRLFADDEVLHKSLLEQGIPIDGPEALGPYRKPDNWLVGRLWLNSGYDLVEAGVPIRRQTPINFYETGPKWRIRFAEAIEKEGVLNDQAREAWQRASEDWQALGNRSVPTTSSFTIKLGQIDELLRRRAETVAELREVTGDVYKRAEQKLINSFDPVAKDALMTPPEKRTKSQQSIAEKNLSQIEPNLDEVARDADPAVRARALQLVETVKDLDERIIKTEGHRKQINYPYWETLTQAEQEERTVNARRLIFEAKEALSKEGELERAIDLYEQSFEQWAEIFDDYPILVIDTSAEDLFDSVRDYMKAIDSDELPDDFPLKTFVEMMGQYGTVDAAVYEDVRNTQREKLEARKAELAEQERQREEELMQGQDEEEEVGDTQTGDTESGDKEVGDTQRGDAAEDDAGKEAVMESSAGQPGAENTDAAPPETAEKAAGENVESPTEEAEAETEAEAEAESNGVD